MSCEHVHGEIGSSSCVKENISVHICVLYKLGQKFRLNVLSVWSVVENVTPAVSVP